MMITGGKSLSLGPNKKGLPIMKKLNFYKIRRLLATSRAVSGIGAVAILAVLVFVAIGSAQAAGIEQNQAIHPGDGESGGILLTAKDTKTADAAKKDDKASGGKEAAAKKDAKAEEKPHGIAGWLLDYLAKNPFAYLFLALAPGYPLGRVTVAMKATSV